MSIKQKKLYIAGMGMVTPVGGNVDMTAAAVNAGISGYALSEYIDDQELPITMAKVPDIIFDQANIEIEEGDRYNACHDRIIKMAVLAIREACSNHSAESSIPLILAMPDVQVDMDGLIPMVMCLEQNCQPWVNAKQYRNIFSGRAAGIEAIEFAFNYLYDTPNKFILIGGSDSYHDQQRLDPLISEGRLLAPGNMDCFAPGESAGFLLLTRHPELALVKDGNIIAINQPGVADEPGHLNSKEPFLCVGLDQAFKKALSHVSSESIHTVYSSMNGENHWAKEYGVAYLRNKTAFIDAMKTEHPSDIYGDIGSATAPVLLALAAEHLFKHDEVHSHLIYSSSDQSRRGAVVIEKINYVSQSVSKIPGNIQII